MFDRFAHAPLKNAVALPVLSCQLVEIASPCYSDPVFFFYVSLRPLPLLYLDFASGAYVHVRKTQV